MCCWPLPVQSFSGPSLLRVATIFYCLRFETSLFVASYDSQGHGGGIRPRLHTGCTVSTDGLQDNSSARIPRKTFSLLLRFGVFTERLPSNGRGTDSIENGLSDCCLATSNNIRNSIFACVYATEVCLQVVA
jgi:hypothetical protein